MTLTKEKRRDYMRVYRREHKPCKPSVNPCENCPQLKGLIATVSPVQLQDKQAIDNTLKALPSSIISKAISHTIKAAMNYK